ncbi:MAG: EAL domain-containing protein [Granulosicoccus sp.]
MLKKPYNMGTADRVIRFTISFPLIYLGFINAGIIGDNVLNIAVGVFGCLNLISALLGICPAYLLVNASTANSLLKNSALAESCASIDTSRRTNDIPSMRRKLLLSVVLPPIALLVLFGWTIFQHNHQSELTELSHRQDAAARIAIHIQQNSSVIGSDTIGKIEAQPASSVIQELLVDTDMFLLHDAQLTHIPAAFEKGVHRYALIDALRGDIGSFELLGNAYKRGMTVVDGDSFLWSTTQLGNGTHWITAVWRTPGHHGMFNQLITARFLITVLAVSWMAIWSSSYIVRKFMDNVEDNATKLYNSSLHDSLTGLPNRLKIESVIVDHVERLNTDNNCVVLLIIDLIEFRDVNDTLGHVMGDELLVTVGNLLRELEDDKATVVRMGGDVFCLVCNVGQNRIEANRLANAVHDKLKKRHELNGIPIAIQARVGVSCYPMDSADPQELVRLADIALAQAKHQRVKDMFYQQELDTHSIRKLSLLSRLRTAIEQDELTLVYQPKVDIHNNALVGVEVLARWTDAHYGPVSPVEFVTWAEKTGLINKLTRWVMISAECQCREWRDRGYVIPFAVNLSPTNLHDNQLIPLIVDLVEKGSFGSGMLELELTENAVMEDPDKALDTMKILSKLGVSIAIDDFGTGLSSFTYLRKFPVTNLKIDRAFVMDIDDSDRDALLLHSMIKLGHSLECVVTAEGVEDQASLDKLKSFNCDYVQGYHVCKPLSADQLIRWLSSSEWTAERKAA